MAIKFSQFVLKTLPSELDYIVGYKGTENLQITPDNFLAPYLGAYLPLAGGNMTGDLVCNDGVAAAFGTGVDAFFKHSGSDFSFFNDVGNVTFNQRADDKDIIFNCDDGAGGTTTYMTIDGGAENIHFSKPVGVGTSVPAYNLQVESAGNAEIQSQRTGGAGVLIQSQAAVGVVGTNTNHRLDLKTNNTTYMTITPSGDVGIGLTAPSAKVDIGGMADPVVRIISDVGGDPQLRFDGSAANRSGLIKFYDNGAAAGGFIDYHHLGDKMNFGAGSVSTVTMTVTDGDVGIGIESPTHALHVDTTAAGATNPSYIVSDSGGVFTMAIGTQNSPGVAQEAFVGTLSNTDFKIMANSAFVGRITTTGRLMLGSGGVPEESIQAGGAIVATATNVTSSTAGTNRAIMDLTSGGARLGHFRGTTAAGSGSVKLYSDSVLGITLDASQNTQFAGNVGLETGQVQLGPLSGGDLKLYFDATDGIIVNKTGDLKILNQGNDKDIYFQTDDGSGGTRTYLYLDGSQAAAGDACWTIWPDNSRIGVGTDKDLQIHHESGNNYITQTVGDLIISNTADDKDIQFKSDDGAGNTTLYYYLDGSIVKNRFPKDIYLEDDVKLLFGDASTPDLEIYHDTSNSYIVDAGTGSLKVGAANWHLMNSALTSYMMTATPGAECNLYYNGSGKFITTTNGVKVTGQYDIAALNTAPASASATGTLGEIRYTADYIYVCTATNTWKRSALSTW